ncbi:MAG: dTMP kinase [Candidatus Saccharimonadales bacterium]
MSYNKEGLLLSFEGQDGSGKSTLLELVGATLQENGHKVEIVPEFSERVIGSYLVNQLTENKFLRMNRDGASALTETLYIVADLYSQDEFDIKPALAQGKIVLKERHLDSIFACQIPKILADYPDRREGELTGWLDSLCSSLKEPDLTVFLDVPEIELRNRIVGRGEAISESDITVFKSRQAIYDRIATTGLKRWMRTDNQHSPDRTAEVIIRKVEEILSSQP